MTAEQKAKELIWEYLPILEGWKFENSNLAKKCAIIAVDEILNLMINTLKWDANCNGNIEYWQDVKLEIDKL